MSIRIEPGQRRDFLGIHPGRSVYAACRMCGNLTLIDLTQPRGYDPMGRPFWNCDACGEAFYLEDVKEWAEAVYIRVIGE